MKNLVVLSPVFVRFRPFYQFFANCVCFCIHSLEHLPNSYGKGRFHPVKTALLSIPVTYFLFQLLTTLNFKSIQ